MSEGDRKDSRNPRGQGGGEGGEGEGGSASFLRDASRLERTALRPPFPPPARRHVLRSIPLAPSRPSPSPPLTAKLQGPSARGRGREESLWRATAAEGRGRAIREDGRHSNLSWQACSSPASPSLAGLSARRLPSHRLKAGSPSGRTNDRNPIEYISSTLSGQSIFISKQQSFLCTIDESETRNAKLTARS